MEETIIRKLEEQDGKLQEIYKSMKRLEAYFRWTLIITVVAIVLPMIGLMVVIPKFLGSLSSSLSIPGL